jgi:hypothetical protein
MTVWSTLTEDGVQRIGRGLLQALAVAHGAGVLHRDVKPSNVLLDEDGEAMLTDFSIARSVGQGTVTNTGMVGSPGYIAPERVINGTAGPEADLFGLGATLFFAAEGVPPFAHDDALAGAFAAAIQPHPRPQHAGPDLTPLLDGLLEKDPRQRLSIAAAAQLLGMPDPSQTPGTSGHAPISAPSPPAKPAKVTPLLHPDTVEKPSVSAAQPEAFATGRAKFAVPEPITEEDATPPAAPDKWAFGRLALIAVVVVALAGAAAALNQVIKLSSDELAQPPSSSTPEPSGSQPASPSSSPSPTQDPAEAFYLNMFKEHGFGDFANGWAPAIDQCPDNKPDVVVCQLKGDGRRLFLARVTSASAASDTMRCGYMGNVKTGPANLRPNKVKLSGSTSSRAGYYCEGWEEWADLKGANLRISWTDPAQRMVASLGIWIDKPFSELESALNRTRSLWEQYA